MTGSNPAGRSKVLAGSTQGERARLLTGNEVGSIPTLPAIYRRAVDGQRVSKTCLCGFDPYRRCQFEGVAERIALACKAGVCRVEPATLSKSWRCSFNGRTEECGSSNRGSIPRHRPILAGIV